MKNGKKSSATALSMTTIMQQLCCPKCKNKTLINVVQLKMSGVSDKYPQWCMNLIEYQKIFCIHEIF